MKLYTSLVAIGLAVLLGGCATTSTPPMALGMNGTSSAEQHNAAGIKHYKMGHWDVAKGHFEEAVEANPKLPEPHYNLALAFHQLGSHEEATKHFKHAAELAPNNLLLTNSRVYKSHMGMTSQDSYRESSGGY